MGKANMIYRELGKTGWEVSVVSFGGMRFFHKDEAVAVATVRRCLDLGINFFETGSYGSGKSEVMLGQALKGLKQYPRESYYLADKCWVDVKAPADNARASLEKSLERQETAFFDLYGVWGMNTAETFKFVTKKKGTLSVLEQARNDGLIKAIGFSTHAPPEMILKFAKAYPWTAVTLKEHMLYARHGEVIEELLQMGIGVIVMSPLAGGVVCAPGPEIKERLAKARMSAPLLGLRFLVAQPGVTTVISGMADPKEVDENTKAGKTGAPLSAKERDMVAFIQDQTSRLGGKFCTSCGYCLPCPKGVNIPGIFRLWNIMRGYGNSEYSQGEYAKLCDQTHWADFSGAGAAACVECGKCEKKCPEQLPICEDLKKAHAELAVKQAGK